MIIKIIIDTKRIKMSVEKGISRIGTVGGVIFGLYSIIFGIPIYIKNSEFRYLRGSDAEITFLVVVIMMFLIGFFAAKGVAKTINWIIAGFRMDREVDLLKKAVDFDDYENKDN